MGEVYRAIDTKLDREVAIKVLPESMAQDPERVARFEREAKVLAQLNHPMIAAIYGFDEASGKRFLVLELVEGPTLADRLKNGRLPVDEAVDIARQIAQALEVAHDKGIIHRDLKPANVKVTADGQVKVLDFGLAKALAEEVSSDDPANSPTITKDFTRPGVILGTAAYMSPEQARGHAVDKRSDIWAFGCVLYECLTGDSMFRGETVTDSIGAILHKQPEWERLPANTPPTVQLLLRRCLVKDRKRRLRDIGDVRIELESSLSDPSSPFLGLAKTESPIHRKSSTQRLHGVANCIASVAVGALITLAAVWLTRPRTAAPPSELQMRQLIPNLVGAEFPPAAAPPVVSPDGTRIVYYREESLWLLELSRLDPRALPKTDSAFHPFWSPDSKEIGYFANDRMWRMDVVGGTPEPIAKLPAGFKYDGGSGGAAWLDDGSIIFTSGSQQAEGLWKVSARGGVDPELVLATGDAQVEKDFENVSALPKGKGTLFIVQSVSGSRDQMEVFANGKRTVILKRPNEDLRFPRYSTSGHILYRRETTNPGIYAVPFSLDSLKVVEEEAFFVADGRWPSVANDGSLLYTSFPKATSRLVWIDRAGKIEPIENELRQPPWASVSLSPDEKQALVSIEKDRVNRSGAIWLVDLETGMRTSVTNETEGIFDSDPAWHPNGQHVLFKRENFLTRESTIMKSLPDEPGTASALLRDLSYLPSVSGRSLHFSISSDGRNLAYDFPKSEQDGKADIAYVTLTDDRTREILRDTEISEKRPQISPDGRLLAYTDESGEFWVTRFPSQERGRRVDINLENRPSNGPSVCFWGKDKSNLSLYCLDRNNIMHRVTVKFEDDMSHPVLKTNRLFDLSQLRLESSLDSDCQPIDVSRDGERFLAVQRVVDEESVKPIIVQNWYSEDGLKEFASDK